MGIEASSNHLAYYSIYLGRKEDDDFILDQLELSLKSLRQFAEDFPVLVYWYGDTSTSRLKTIERLASEVVFQGSYFDKLSIFGKNRASAIRRHPAVHKYLNFEEIDKRNPRQVLYLDCDTYFCKGIESIFEKYNDHDLYAREEVGSYRFDASTYDPNYLDEGILSSITKNEHVKTVLPFNSGVMLYNRPLWRRDLEFVPRLIQYMWRFMVWMARNPERDSPFAEGRGIDWIRANPEAVSEEDILTELPFPSPNRWIVEEVAAWLSLGHIPKIRTGDFKSADVAYFDEQPSERSPVLCHYFKSNTKRIVKLSHATKGIGSRHRVELMKDIKPASRIVIPEPIASSRLLKESRGFAIYSGLPRAVVLADLYKEARALLPSASHDERWNPIYPDSDEPTLEEDRTAVPRLVKQSCGGGPVQTDLCRDKLLWEFLSDEAGVRVVPTGDGGSFAFYVRPGDFIGLHRDTAYCDLVMLTIVEDTSDSSDVGGSVILYPDRVLESCKQISRTPNVGAETIKMAAGHTLIMFGGVVPHRILPVRAGQSRIVSALCFSLAY